MDLDETLVTLWDAGVDQVRGPGDLIAPGLANRARRILGLATRRELTSTAYWMKRFKVDEIGLVHLLISLGIDDYQPGSRLRKRAVSRLRAEERKRGAPERVVEPRRSAETIQPFRWEPIGHPRDCIGLKPEEVLSIHETLVDDFAASADPIVPSGLKSAHLLGSACHRPSTANGAQKKYPTIEMGAAALLHALVHDHAFHNGNKRTALVSMLVYLDKNGLVLTCDQDDLFKLVLQLAQHALVDGPRHELSDRETLHVAKFLQSHTRWIEKWIRPLPWRRLRRILTHFGCLLEPATGVGNRMNVSRTVARPASGFFGKKKSVELHTQVSYGGEGREADKSTISKIRHDLELDDEHGTDSRAFYDSVAMSPSDFILRYRKTIRRLARL